MKKLLFTMTIAGLLLSSCGEDDGAAIVPDAGTLSGGPFSFVVDGTPDMVSGISVAGTPIGSESTFVITDADNNILGMPPTLEALEGVDFDGAGVGVCFIWYLRYEGDLAGLEEGMSTNDIDGSFALSNSIMVTRSALNAGTLTGGPFTFIVDGTPDMVSGISLDNSEATGDNNTWLITNEEGEILGMPPSLEAVEGVNFDGAGAGVCFIWYMRYGDDLTGLAVGANTSDLDAEKYGLSNSIMVTRNAMNAGTISGGPFTFVVDGIEDNVSGISIDNSEAIGDNSTWVITNEAGEILGLPKTMMDVEAVNFNGAGVGVCFIWYMRHGDALTNLEVGVNTDNLTMGTFALSNSIMVTRNENGNMALNLTGLEDLGDNFAYEGWVIVDGSPVSTGTFSVDGSGNLSQTDFPVNGVSLASASMFVLSIEPVPDTDPAPAATKILSGPFSGSNATVSTGTVGSGFEDATGKYIIATPTGTGASEEEFSGIWFLDNSSGSAVAGLDLPTLADGWKYEGWVVIDGTPVSTGTFTSATGSDDSAPFSGSNAGPAYPGEDFLTNAPAGLTFPTDLRSQTAVISIEPSPDNSASPFALKPLAGMIPATLSGPASLGNNVTASFPSGSVSR
ncbi:MAG: anti-sigma factor [Ekhidna sp.]